MSLAQRITAATVSTAPAPIVPANQWDLLPGGHRIFGANVVPYRNHPGNVPNYPWLADFWHSWPWSSGSAIASGSSNWIKPQIDYAHSIGCNTVRVFGTVAGRTSTSGSQYTAYQISATQFLAQWDQLLTYVRSLGMYCYPTFVGDADPAYGWTMDPAWFATEAAMIARFMVKYQDIIPGIDFYNESTTWYNANQSSAVNVYKACKAVAPNLKFTWSQNAITNNTPPAGSYDFVDMHDYIASGGGIFDPKLQSMGVPILMGEFGAHVDQGAAARQTAYTNAASNANAVNTGRHIAGAMAWCTFDQDLPADVSTNQYGLCNSAGTPYSDIQTYFTTTNFPT